MTDMVVSIDTGNKQIKSKHFTFISGMSQHVTAPTIVALEDYIKVNGKYHVLTNQREEYARDKSESEHYFLLTLMGIVKELDYAEQEQAVIKYDTEQIYGITLLCGLPPAHMEDPELKKRFKSYFKTAEPVKITYKGRVWNMKINKVYVYAQCHAAIMTKFSQLKEYPKALGIDIGGFTADYMMLKRGKIDIANTDSLENGLILLYGNAKRECRKKNDSFIDESDVDEILNGNTEMYSNEDVKIVIECAKKFIEKLLASFREMQIDLKTTYVVFMGGGSLLLKKLIRESPLLNEFCFIDEINANAAGYEFLYTIQQKANVK